MIWQQHVSNCLAPLADGELTASEAARVRAHLDLCASCRDALDRFRLTSTVLRELPLVEAPPQIWAGIETALAGLPRSTAAAMSGPRGREWPAWLALRPALAALVFVALATAGLMIWEKRDIDTQSKVTRIDRPGGEAALGIGEWIETNASSQAKLRIGTIGTVDVAANTRMQVLVAQPGEHRLNLARGSISAQIVAPPRLFFVNTPSSTVVDLGCAYTMTVDETGVGILRVTSGWASLEWSGRESLVPAGASCPTRPAVGPGTPSFDDASDQLKEALLSFDFNDGGRDALDIVLKEARVRDTLTLWHLLSRVGASERALVFERMLALGALPKDVTRDQVLALDAGTLQRWREELAWTW